MSATATPARTAELLAPAGNRECLRAAVANGADAVYFGLEDFNARRRAENFPLAALPEVMSYLHDHNSRGYIAFNTLVYSDELERAGDFIAAIAEAGADAVIVQDAGMVRLIRRMAPTLPIHASTQMTQTHSCGIELLSEMGVQRVILARELSIAEISAISHSTRVELEVFVHGAICISYSGQCLTSESLWGRSANRGVCGQACRLPYELVVDGRVQEPNERPYPLSATDLATWELIPALLAAGVTGFKIEGRLKSAQYVAATTAVYRGAITAALQGRRFQVSREREAELAQSFSRGFTHGFLNGDRHLDLVDGRSPRSRGLKIGTVTGKTRQGVLIEVDDGSAVRCEPPLKPGDGVVFEQRKEERNEQGGRIYAVRTACCDQPKRNRQAAKRLELEFGRDDVNLNAVFVGSTVWKTDDPAVRRRLEASYSRDLVVRRVPLIVRVSLSQDCRLVLEASTGCGQVARVESAEVLERAERHPLTLSLLREQLGRLGDTPFDLASVELIDGGKRVDILQRMAPKSVLNHLRREMTRILIERRAASSRHAVAGRDAVETIRRECRAGLVPAVREDAPAVGALAVLVRDPAQLESTLRMAKDGTAPPISMIYCDFVNACDRADAVSRCRGGGAAVALATTLITKPGEEAFISRLVSLAPDAVLVRNLTALRLLRQEAPQLVLIGDYSLNVTNEITASVMIEQGLSRLTASFDLNVTQLEALSSRSPNTDCEVVIHQHVPMFHMAHCISANMAGSEDCGSCAHPCSRQSVELRDRLGVDHPLMVDEAGRTTVFNARVQSGIELLPQLLRAGVRHFRIDLLDESPEELRTIIDLYRRALRELSGLHTLAGELGGLYREGITRGTFEFA